MDKGIELIKKWEGLRLNAYLCPAKVPTIGYGSTRMNDKPVKLGMRLKSEAEADKLLRDQIKDSYLPSLQEIPVWRQLNRNQQGALLSFAWNLGANFYGSKGFETITRALNNDLSAVPEAMMLYVKAGGKTLEGLVNRRKEEGELWVEPVDQDVIKMIDLIEYSELVAANERLTIVGKYYGEPDAVLTVIADDKFKLPDCQVKDGVIDYGLTLNTPGDRRIKFNKGSDSQEITVKVVLQINPDDNLKPEPAKTVISGGVGVGGKNNRHDVIAVQTKLQSLGYKVGAADGIIGKQTINQIKLFQSIINGQTRVGGDGRVDVGGKTHQWLNSPNAPRWQIMPNSDPSISFRNQELEETWDHHDYGTSWMADAILWIAKHYHDNYRSKVNGSALFSINDVSLPHGGNTPDHAGHETGLCCDVYLPRKDGLTGGIDYLDSRYDKAATEAILVSINKCPMVNKNQIYYNDPHLVKKGLCKSVRGHHHHIHFGVKVPNI